MWRRVWIYTRTGKRSTSYALRWYGDDGRVHTKAASTVRRMAEQMRRELEMRLNSDESFEQPKIRLEAFIKEHLTLIEHQVRPSTLRDHRAISQEFMARSFPMGVYGGGLRKASRSCPVGLGCGGIRGPVRDAKSSR